MCALWKITAIIYLLALIIQGCGGSEVCARHSSPWGVSYHRCDHGCCGTTYDRHCCTDSLTLTVVLSLLGGGIGIVIIVVIVWYITTAKERAKVGPDRVPVMTQTEAV